MKKAVGRWSLVVSILFLLVTCGLGLTTAFAQPISSTELINNAKLYDGKVVVYEGEIIGDVMVRGEFAWVNINDGSNAIGIWIEKNLTRDIIYTGSYKSKGEWMEITGVFHRACLEHGGDLDIHAQAIRKIKPGRPAIEKLNPGKRNLTLILLGGLCLVWILRLLKIK
ncbi:MAG: DNA-binding protein [Candidatus Omnitrophica bacterium]|nr:DNA-binding protein [Candidatus Omnitrophota bacterium]MDD5592466.1 DNA-binding protein [Candidatus Omnitrophota bacterium]